jgi:hypothetical protein
MAKIFKTKQNLVNAGFNQVSGETLTLGGNTLVGDGATLKYATDQHSRYTARSVVDAAFVTGFTSGGTGGGDKNNIYSKTIITGDTILTSGSTYLILVNHDVPITITLPLSPINGQVFKIKDISTLGAFLNNITIDSGVGNTIDGSQYALINTDFGAVELIYNNSPVGWFTLAFIN